MTTDSKKNTKFNLPKRAGFLLILPMTLGFAGLASAHPEGPGSRGGAKADPVRRAQMVKCHEQKRASMIKSFDTNKDGKLSEAERKIARATRKAERLGAYDKDKDGTLSKAERADFLHDKVTEKFESIDSNGDAEIDLAEAEKSCSPLSRHFERVDADGNDSISWTEFEKVAKKRMQRGKHRKRGMRSGESRRRRGPKGHGPAL